MNNHQTNTLLFLSTQLMAREFLSRIEGDIVSFVEKEAKTLYPDSPLLKRQKYLDKKRKEYIKQKAGDITSFKNKVNFILSKFESSNPDIKTVIDSLILKITEELNNSIIQKESSANKENYNIQSI